MIQTIRHLLFCILIASSLSASQSSSAQNDKVTPLKFTIITNFNGVGLQTDCKILKAHLESLGHKVSCSYWNSAQSTEPSDINIFFEQFIPAKKGNAQLNWFVPNPEWFVQSMDDLQGVDLILCRTKEVERIFTNLHKPTYYLGFTSPDCYKQTCEKRYDQLLHVAGCSAAKSTQTILDLWPANPQLPFLNLLTIFNWNFPNPVPPNMNLVNRRLSDDELNTLQNSCGVHLCPSTTEGFGHYIAEAMSTGAVVITTDAPPMNEFITDPRCLVGYKYTAPQRLATNYYVDPELLQTKVQALCSLPKKELEAIGNNNRQEYLKRKEAFLERLTHLVSTVEITPVDSKAAPDKTVLIAILARNKEHVLNRFLKCIENQDYPKNLITIYIKTDNNSDNTKEILQEWAYRNEGIYKNVVFDDSVTLKIPPNSDPHLWNAQRFKALATIRNNSLQKAKEHSCDYYFVVDCDNFIAPYTLKDLVAQDKPIIAPFLRCIPEVNDLYANFFYSAAANGYYNDHPMHIPIVTRKMIGTYKVDLVHCTYLVNSKYLDKLSYIDDTNDYEFIIFARSARNNNIDQYVTNEKEYGVQIHFNDNVSLEEEKRRIESILTLP